MQQKLHPPGYLQLCNLYLERLLTKKCVATIANFEAADADAVVELCNEFPQFRNEIRAALDNLKGICDVDGYFEDLGTGKRTKKQANN